MDCQFVSDEECVILSKAALGGSSLRLFNVESGELLTVIDLLEREVSNLAVCPRKRLLAIGGSNPEFGFELIQVHLPRDKDSWKSKEDAGQHTTVQKDLCQEMKRRFRVMLPE